MRVALVIGTRPQIIKSAPIIKEAGKQGLELDVIHTGQHYDYKMSKAFFNELELPDPVVNLEVGSGPNGEQTGRMLIELEKTYQQLKPDLVMVPGDTNSTLAGALAATKMHIPVAHVEAGARSFDMSMPEEVNRRLTDHCSSILFTVSENCTRNLVSEGIEEDRIHLVGDTMYESIVSHMEDINNNDIVERLKLDQPYAVLTVHRAENTDNGDRLHGIFSAIHQIGLKVVFPCHPRTRKKLEEAELLRDIESWPHISLIEPLPYYSMLKLVKNADIVLTDSGGLQKEAFWLGTPCVTLRDNTEWMETIELKMNRLVRADTEKILTVSKEMRESKHKAFINPYEFNCVSKKIIETLYSDDIGTKS